MFRLCNNMLQNGKILGFSNVVLKINVIGVRNISRQFDIETWMKTLDEAQQKRVRFIQNEVTLLRLENRYAPKLEFLTQADFEFILSCSQTKRQKYYNYLYKTENAGSTEQMKKEIKRRIFEEKEVLLKASENQPNKQKHIEYGLGKNSLIPKVYNRTIDKWRNAKTAWRMALNYPKIIFDCGFSAEMSYRENFEASKQLTRCFGLNRSHKSPFVLHYANMNMESQLWTCLKRQMPGLLEKPLPIQIHQQDIVELFPRDKLIVLTPDSPNIMREYNPNMHYVVSAIVDRGDKIPASLAKAKKFDLQTARLPLEQYRKCRTNKVLSLDQIMSVMLEIKHKRDWNKAFSYVATRKFS